MRRLAVIILVLTWCAAVRAQYSSGFEPPLYAANAAGVALTGQDGWYNPLAGTPNAAVLTYIPNNYNIAVNPQGAQQFAAARGTGAAATTQGEHFVNFAGGDSWTVSWDVAVRFGGVAPASNPIGSFSLENSINSRSFAALATWVNPNAPAAWNAGFLVYDAAGVAAPSPGLFPGAAWQNLLANRWYRQSVSFSFSQNRILEVSITDLTTQATARVTPAGWYLRGGANPLLPPPTAIRFTGAGAVAGNIHAFDNLDSCAFQVAGFTPPQAQEGGTVFISGCGFGNRTEDLSVSLLQPGGNGIPLTVLQVTNTLITARMGPVPLGSPAGRLEVIRHSGSRGVFNATIDDIIQEDQQGTHVWDRNQDPRRAQSTSDFVPLFSPPPPGTQWYFGALVSGHAEVLLTTPAAGLEPNTTLRIVTRLHHNAQQVGSDLEETRIRLRIGANGADAPQYLAERVCDAIKQGLASQGINSAFTINTTGQPNQRRIEITLQDASHVTVPIDFGILDVARIDPIRIDPFTIGPVTAFFNAGLVNQGTSAQVTPVDMSGNDGATISPLVPLSGGMRIDTELISLNLLGSSFTTRSWGTLAGQLNQHLGTLSVRHNVASFFDVFADFSDVGASQVRLDVYYNTALKASLTLPLGNVSQISPSPNFPRLTGCGGRPNNGTNNSFLWIDFDQPCIITPSGGTPVVGNQIRVFAGPGAAVVQNFQAFDLAAGLDQPLDAGAFVVFSSVEGGVCYANCDGSTVAPVLNVQDFACFLNLFAGGDAAANCDGSTTAPVLNVGDFGCFLNAFAAGCS